MKIGIIGSGFLGLSAAYSLLKKGHKVWLFEKEGKPGGLAVGHKEINWDWPLETHYHHFFTNDNSILGLAKEIDLEAITKQAKTSIYIDGKIYQLDSPRNIFSFPPLTLLERTRMAATLGFLRYNPFWKPLERVKTKDFLPFAMGKRAYSKIWEPQLRNKFGDFANDISLAWFWARIRKRTASLSYPKGGFSKFANSLARTIEEKGGKVIFKANVNEVKSNDRVLLNYTLGDKRFLETFDKVIVTFPAFLFLKIAPKLPDNYKKKLNLLKGLGAINLVLHLKNQFLKDGTYWLSICDIKSPIMAIVEHTNFMDKKYYNDEHIVYLGNYLSHTHPYMRATAKQLLKIYDPFLQKINPNYQLSIIDYRLFKAPFAQPIIPTHYSKVIPTIETPLKNVFLANMQQVYPWDRGTNYAVSLGEKVAKLVEDK